MRKVSTRSIQQTSVAADRKGSMLVLAAFMLVVLCGFVAFSVDLGFVAMTKSQLQNAADSAALATAASLTNTTLDEKDREALAKGWGVSFANQNQGQHGEVLRTSDVTLGVWDSGVKTFTPTTGDIKPNAAQVVVKRAGSNGNEVPLFFARVLGTKSIDVTATAIATSAEDDPRDVILVIDCSKSMKGKSRMDFTQAAAYALIDELMTTDRLGLVVYNYVEKDGTKTGHLENSMSFTHAPVVSRIPQLKPGLYDDWTNIAGGIRVALDEFKNNPRGSGKKAKKIIVLMTDGHANIAEFPQTSPTHSITYYAGLAAKQDVTIHSVTLGNGADKIWVRDAAEIADGTYHHVEDGNPQGLLEVFKKIGRGDGRIKLVR